MPGLQVKAAFWQGDITGHPMPHAPGGILASWIRVCVCVCHLPSAGCRLLRRWALGSSEIKPRNTRGSGRARFGHRHPSRGLGIAASEAEANFAVYVCNEPNGPSQEAYSSYKPAGPSGEAKFYPGREGGAGGDPTLKTARVSNQGGIIPCGGSSGTPCKNRHTLTHELGHAFGLEHYPFAGSGMGPPQQPKNYWTPIDMSAIAATQDKRVTCGMGLKEVFSALGVESCPADLSAAEFGAAPPGAGWDVVALWMCEKMPGRLDGSTCELSSRW